MDSSSACEVDADDVWLSAFFHINVVAPYWCPVTVGSDATEPNSGTLEYYSATVSAPAGTPSTWTVFFQNAAPYSTIVTELDAVLHTNGTGMVGDISAYYDAATAGVDGTSSEDIAINSLYAPGGEVGTADAYLPYQIPQFVMSGPNDPVGTGDYMTLQVKFRPVGTSQYQWLVDGAPLGTTSASAWSGAAPSSAGTHTFRVNLFDSSGTYLGNTTLDVDVE